MKEKKIMNKIIDGVGKDAEIVVNEKGGKQSKSPMAMHLIDPCFLQLWTNLDLTDVFMPIGEFMETGEINYLLHAIDCIEPEEAKVLMRIAKVLKEGADKYTPNNWRLIPQEEHINHALIHLLAHEMGDTQDNHLDHALCRLMMAYATKKSENFDYCYYKPSVK